MPISVWTCFRPGIQADMQIAATTPMEYGPNIGFQFSFLCKTCHYGVTWLATHARISANPFHRSWMVVEGNINGNRQIYHMKYYSVFIVISSIFIESYRHIPERCKPYWRWQRGMFEWSMRKRYPLQKQCQRRRPVPAAARMPTSPWYAQQ